MADYDYLDKGQDDGTILGKDATRKIGFWGVTPVVQPIALTPQLTTITHTTIGAADYALAAPVSAAWAFSTADEFLTTMSVILNLQTRLAQVEARLEECGIVKAN